MSDLYEDDILLWSERQAGLLRRVAAGDRVNDRDLDWANLGEEIEAVGRSELRAVESLSTQAIVYRLKQLCWPASGEFRHRRGEEIRFRQDAADAFSPSMGQRIDLARLNRRAAQQLPADIDGMSAAPVPDLSGVTLDEWLDAD